MPDTSCTVVLIHGIGSQKKTWSQDFRSNLRSELGADAARVRMVDAYWAPASTFKELIRPTLALAGAPCTTVSDDAYLRSAREFARMLAADGGARPDALAFGAGDIVKFLKNKLNTAEDLIADVGNYVGRNGVRSAVQQVLHGLLGVEAVDPGRRVLVVAHSQGTIISYDVLREAGQNYPGLRTLITMGSPLRKYVGPLQWGRAQLGVPAGLRWLNVYDKNDIVGKDLKGALDWQAPQPVDTLVDNVKNAGGAHNHWANPQVTKLVAAEVRKLLVL
jgi:pimeloyl-ACP methyl ester carboxylesterase